MSAGLLLVSSARSRPPAHIALAYPTSLLATSSGNEQHTATEHGDRSGGGSRKSRETDIARPDQPFFAPIPETGFWLFLLLRHAASATALPAYRWPRLAQVLAVGELPDGVIPKAVLLAAGGGTSDRPSPFRHEHLALSATTVHHGVQGRRAMRSRCTASRRR